MEGWQVLNHTIQPSPEFGRHALANADAAQNEMADIIGGLEYRMEDSTNHLITFTKNRALRWITSSNTHDVLRNIYNDGGGTVTITGGAITVGSGFLTNLVKNGDLFKATADSVWSVISAITATTFTATPNPATQGAGKTYEIDRLHSGTTHQLFSATVVQDRICWSQGINPIMQWTGSGNPSYLTLLYPAFFLESDDHRLVLASTIEGGTPQPNRVRFTVQGDITNFTGFGSGFIDVVDRPDHIAGLKQLQGTVILYKRRSIFIGVKTGNYLLPYTFIIKDRGTGLRAPYSLASTGETHLFVGNDDIYEFDGVRKRSITTVTADPRFGRIRRSFFNSINADRLNTIFGYYDKLRQEYYLAVTPPGQEWPTDIWVWNRQEDTWRRDKLGPGLYARSFFHYRTTAFVSYDDLVGTYDAQVGTYDSSSSTAGARITLMGLGTGPSEGTVLAETKQLIVTGAATNPALKSEATVTLADNDLDTPALWKTLSEIDVQYRGASEGVVLTLTVNFRDPFGNDAEVSSLAVPVSATTSGQWRRGRVFVWLTGELFQISYELIRGTLIEVSELSCKYVPRGDVQPI